MPQTTSLIGIVGRAIRRPGLLIALLAAAWRFRARGWWRRPPFLPVPPREYIAWRMHTAYGGGEGGGEREPSVDELEGYVRWANRMHRGRGGGRGGVTL